MPQTRKRREIGKRSIRRALRIEPLEQRCLLDGAGDNLAPVLVDPGDQTMTAQRDPLTITLSASDANSADSLTYSAVANRPEYHLDQSIGFVFTGDYTQNASGSLNEKWLLTVDEAWHYLTPDGGLWRWLGGRYSNAVKIAELSPETYADPRLLYNAQPGDGPADVAIDGAVLTLTAHGGFIGEFSVDVTVSDGFLSDTQQFVVTVLGNRAPIFVDPGPLSMSERDESLQFTLAATDPDGDEVTYTAVAQSTEYFLDQSLGLSSSGDYFFDYGGSAEKWMAGHGDSWYYVTPAGQLRNWLGGDLEDDPLVAELSTEVYDDPSLLHDALPGDAPASVTKDDATQVLTVTPDDGFTGVFSIAASASDGELTTYLEIPVTVRKNRAPEFEQIDDLSIFNEQTRVTIPVVANDPDGDLLSYSIVLHSNEYYLDQTLDFAPADDYFTNFGGLNEKWLVAADEAWYYITPDGRFWRWRGAAAANADLVATLDPDTYSDPARLFDAQPGTASTTTFADATLNKAGLAIALQPGFVGAVLLEVTVSDGLLSSSESAAVYVTVVQNEPPVLSHLDDQRFMTTVDRTEVSVSATDPDNDPLTFSAIVHTAEYYLDQTLDFQFTGDLSFNFGGLQEKWILAAAQSLWYYITPDGQLWSAPTGGIKNAVAEVKLSPATYVNPERLYDAQPGRGSGSASISDGILTVNPRAKFVGLLGVEAIVSDGRDSDSQLILVTVDPFDIVGRDQLVNGRSHDELAEDWFRWLVGDAVTPSEFPFDFPLTDTSGIEANDNQHDPDVFFVSGVFGTNAVRSFTVPAGQQMLIALAASFWTNLPGGDPALGAVATRQSIDAVQSMSLTVDDTVISPDSLFRRRAGGTNLAATFAENNWFDLATNGLFPAGTTGGHSVDGYWALVPPLSPGQHTIRFTSVASGQFQDEAGFSATEIAGSANTSISFSQDVTLRIAVAAVPGAAAAKRPLFVPPRARVEDPLADPPRIAREPVANLFSAPRPVAIAPRLLERRDPTRPATQPPDDLEAILDLLVVHDLFPEGTRDGLTQRREAAK